MPRRLLVTHLQSLAEKLDSDYKLSSRHFGREAIHEMRVDIKRIRACLLLVDSMLAEDRSSEILSRLKRLFKRAGKVRHFQLEMDITRRHIDDSSLKLDWYYNLLKAEEILHRRRFAAFCADFDLDFVGRGARKLGRLLDPINNDSTVRLIRRHFEILLNRLQESKIEDQSESTDFHAIRILSKETRYVLEVLRKFPATGDFYDVLDKHLLGLHQALGAWHDLDVSVVDLQHFHASLPPDTDICTESYTRYLAALTTERDLQLELFRSRWIDFHALEQTSTQHESSHKAGNQG